MGLEVKKSRPSLLRTNGKAEPFIQRLLTEWAYVLTFGSSAAKNDPLPHCLRIHKGLDCHTGLVDLPPAAA